MIKKLIKLANYLDSKGLVKEADYLDNIIKKAGEKKSDKKWVTFEEAYRKRLEDAEPYPGIEEMRDIGWHRQLHLFTYPFYYIEYGIAQLGALQIWLQSLESVEKALENYAQSMKLGGSKALPELFNAAELEFSFDPETVRHLIDAVQEKLADLPA